MGPFCGSKRFLIACFSIAGVVLAVPATAGVIGVPQTFMGHTYYLLDGKTWLEQEAEAIALGGHLVTINDATENAWLWDTFTPPPREGLFFGFNDFAVEGDWGVAKR